jgi:ABC-type transport system involved in multi-copper enzyme maturation permease subunit
MDAYRVTGTGQAYLDFMQFQGGITVLLLAFAGSTLIGSDYQHGGLVFYLSRRIDRRHYVAGKLLAVMAIVALITTLPALVLFAQYGLMSSSFAYFYEEYRIVLGILGYGLVLAVVQGFLLFAVAACLPRTVPLVMTWLGLFVLLKALAEALRQINGNRQWRLIALWDDMLRVGRWCFGFQDYGAPSPLWCFAVLLATCAVCLIVILRRVRAVEVVR